MCDDSLILRLDPDLPDGEKRRRLQLLVEAKKEEKKKQARLRAAEKDEKHNDQVRIQSDASTELTRIDVPADNAEVRN